MLRYFIFGNKFNHFFMNKFLLTLAIFLLLTSIEVSSQVTIPVRTDEVALILQRDDNGYLRTVYLGEPLQNEDEYQDITSVRLLNEQGATRNNLAYSAAGTNAMFEPAIAVVHADGNNSLDLIYEKHTVKKEANGAVTTAVFLKDRIYDFQVELYYRAWPQENVIEQWSVISHGEKGKVLLNKFTSANLYFYDRDYYLTSYNGGWARELQPVETALQQGIHSIRSILGTRANLLGSSNFILSFDGKATEQNGDVLMGQLAWSGNYNIEFEIDAYKNLRLIAGINGYQSAYELKSGERFETPRLIYTFSTTGTGMASRNLHNWLRRHQLHDGEGDRLTLLNNWEATYFDFDEDKLISLFSGAKELGVNMFLLDDGWFGNKYPRNGDQAGLGDWQVNRKKIPHGIKNLADEAEKVGIKFGIWIEPEMVNPKSELYEKHPEWVIREPQRPEIYFRNQLVLDLTNPEVQDFVFGVVDELLTSTPELAFIKWDCNAPIFNAHSEYLRKTRKPQSHLYIDYVRGLEKVLQRVRNKYPEIPMMLCSGGGGRTDYDLLEYFSEFWPSDNTDPIDRIFMQWDYSYYYPAIAVANHVTNWSNKPLKFRIDVASMGRLGFDIEVAELDEVELAFCRQSVRNYDEFKSIVWHGDMYRLISPHATNMASLMYVDPGKSEAVMFNYLTDWRYTTTATQRPIRLQGLDPEKYYRVNEINLAENARSPIDSEAVYSGDFLMKVGINPSVNNRRTSVVLRINETTPPGRK